MSPATLGMKKQPRFSKPGLLCGGAALAGVAGYVNVVMLLLFRVPVSHMSGAASHLSEELAMQDGSAAAYVAAILLSFLGGATLCGVIIGKSVLRLGRRYGLILMIEGGFLALAAVLAQRGMTAALLPSAFACGLQNAMATTYHHQIIRTTHVTGIVTDLGLLIGHAFKGEPIRRFAAMMLVVLLSGFIAGGLMGVLLFSAFGSGVLWLPAVGTMIAGAIYTSWRHHRHLRL